MLTSREENNFGVSVSSPVYYSVKLDRGVSGIYGRSAS